MALVITSCNFLEVADEDGEGSPLSSLEQNLAAVALFNKICETYNLHSSVRAQLDSPQLLSA